MSEIYMIYLNNNEKRNNKSVLRALSLAMLTAATIAVVTGPITIVMVGISQSAEASTEESTEARFLPFKRAPSVVSGDNIYIAWWTNNTENGNEEVMFRASNDDGATFSDKMNLSNTPNADSWRVEVAGEGATVLVTWWETNQTSDTPVGRLSTDGGQSFGPMMMLATNGTISSTEEGAAVAAEGEGGEGAEGEEAAAANGGG